MCMGHTSARIASARVTIVVREKLPMKTRNYQQEYASETSARRKKRAARNRARYKYIKAGKARVGDGKDVDHRNGNALDNSSSNLSLMGRAQNLAKKRK